MSGSSPLTQGKHPRIQGAQHHRRLIPAHAGKTPEEPFGLRRIPAHPRSCGENRDGIMEQIVSVGSSPLTRGKRKEPWYATPVDGLIPTHAGKTSSCGPAPGP